MKDIRIKRFIMEEGYDNYHHVFIGCDFIITYSDYTVRHVGSEEFYYYLRKFKEAYHIKESVHAYKSPFNKNHSIFITTIEAL